MNRNIFKRKFWYFAVITFLVFMLSGTNAFADVVNDNGEPVSVVPGSPLSMNINPGSWEYLLIMRRTPVLALLPTI